MVETGLCFLLASIVGSVTYIFMYGLQRILGSDEYIRLNHMLWHGVIVIYLILLFCGWLLNLWLLANPGKYIWGAVSLPVRSVLETISILWLIGAVIQLTYYTVFRMKHNRILGSATECDSRVNTISDELKKILSINQHVRVLQGYGLTAPELVGFTQPTIYLPGDTSYTDEQIRSIIAHELYHYMHRDKWFRELAVIVHCINWFNPVIPCINRKMEYWDEICCDYEVINSGIASKKEYGETLFKLASKMVKWEQDASTILAIGMCKKKSFLKERVIRIMRYNGHSKQKMGLFGICLIGMILLGSTTALAVGDGAAQVLQLVNEKTVVEYEEEVVPGIGLIEYIETVDITESGIDINEQVSPMAASSGQFETTLKNGEWRSGYFSASAGQTIGVTVYSSSDDVELKVGIYDPAGYLRYIVTSGDVMHQFELSRTGSYFVYIRNETNTPVTISGSYQTLNFK